MKRLSQRYKKKTSVSKKMSSIKKSVDYNEQKSRNICLLIHGVPEGDHDDTDKLSLQVINNEVGVNMKFEDI